MSFFPWLRGDRRTPEKRRGFIVARRRHQAVRRQAGWPSRSACASATNWLRRVRSLPLRPNRDPYQPSRLPHGKHRRDAGIGNHCHAPPPPGVRRPVSLASGRWNRQRRRTRPGARPPTRSKRAQPPGTIAGSWLRSPARFTVIPGKPGRTGAARFTRQGPAGVRMPPRLCACMSPVDGRLDIASRETNLGAKCFADAVPSTWRRARRSDRPRPQPARA